MDAEDRPAAARPRGRPRIDAAALTERQAGVLASAGRLLGERASGDITVEQLLQATGISRPTFYRWFPQGLEQVLDMLLADANRDLVTRMVTALALAGAGGVEASVRAAIAAYFEWGFVQGAVVKGIYREAFREGSAAQRYRRQTVDTAVALLGEQARRAGLAEPPPRVIETLVSWTEAAGVVLFRHWPVEQEEVAAQCELTTQMFLSMLGWWQAQAPTTPPSPSS